MADGQLLRFRYGRFSIFLTILGLGPMFTGMQVEPELLRVRFSWAFSARIPLASIRSVDYDYDFIGGVGVHGSHGVWLVNGAGSGLVAIDIDPPARAYVTGFPVRLRRLRVSALDPARLIALLRP
jgi:hypothetical protein